MEIRSPKTKAEWNAYYKLRFEVLRQPWGQENGSEKDANEACGFHYACFSAAKIVGVGRLDLVNDQTFQIRFMAVDAKAQKSGIGKALMLAMEKDAWAKGVVNIILHAREIALPFYSKLGYELKEKSHLLFGEIQHFLMEKKKGMANHPFP